MTRSSASLFRLRSVVGTAAVAVVLGSVGAAPAQAETPDGAPASPSTAPSTAPSSAPASAPGDSVPVDVPTAPEPTDPATSSEVAVSAVVVDAQGAEVVTVEVDRSAVARTTSELRAVRRLGLGRRGADGTEHDCDRRGTDDGPQAEQ